MMKPNAEEIEEIKEIMRMSIDFETACLSLDIEKETIAEWSELPEIKKAISEAEAQFKVMLTKKLWEEGGIKGIEILLERLEGMFEGNEFE